MTVHSPPGLELPAMLHGTSEGIRHEVQATGAKWAQEYLQTGGFSPPHRMLRVAPDELLIMDSGAEFDIIDRPRWRIHLFTTVFRSVNDNLPKEVRQRAREAFDSFCLSTPWGALFHAVAPYPPWSAQHMARRLAALLRFWDVLENPRYAFWSNRRDTLGELLEDLYRMTWEAWCPDGPAAPRERLALLIERMSRATREECLEALVRMIPVLVRANADLRHPEILQDPTFLRERLASLPPGEFEALSSAYRHAVNGPLCAWDRALGRH